MQGMDDRKVKGMAIFNVFGRGSVTEIGMRNEKSRRQGTHGRRIRVLLLVSLVCGLALSVNGVKSQEQPWMNSKLPIAKRVDLLLQQMTLDEKITMVHGWGGSPYVGYVPANTRLGIPALNLEDGPCGVADGMTNVTQFPAAIAISASWNLNLMKRYGRDMATEELGKGANIQLGPTVNILRNPVWGRSFESLGEDPYLNGQMAIADIDGIQSTGAMACLKHYDAYNQEFDRGNGSANVDERTLHEIYMPAFDIAVKQAHPASIMTAYNRINGIFCSENRYILTNVLFHRWAYPGFTMSDWGGTHSTVDAANNGLDMEMPDGQYFGDALKTAIQNGTVSEATLNDKVRRILFEMFRFHLFTKKPIGSPAAHVDTPEHAQFTRIAAEQGTVLLKNEGSILPLNSNRVHSIAVIGFDASTNPKSAGGGSASVIAPYVITPLQGIKNRIGSKISVQYAEGVASNTGAMPAIPSQYLSPSDQSAGHGLQGEYFSNTNLEGQPTATKTVPNIDFNWHGGPAARDVGGDNWSARWTGTLTPPKTGEYVFSLTSDDGSRLYIGNQLLINNWGNHAAQTVTASISLNANQAYPIRVEYFQGTGDSLITLGWRMPGGMSMMDEATALARKSDVAVVFANDFESEGGDRPDLSLPNNQDQLIEAVSEANPNTIVVLNTGAPVLMPWIKQVKGIVEAWYPGQEDGNSIAAVLFGDMNPSGKLPMTFPKNAQDIPANTVEQYPGVNQVSHYTEGIFVGYRYYDKNGIQPLFPFGFGLSYTKFAFSGLRLSSSRLSKNQGLTVTLDLKNTGNRDGAEVVQVYAGDPVSTGEPPKQLAGFSKVFLRKGQTKRVQIDIAPRAFAYWSMAKHDWVTASGKYKIMVGDSSRNILLNGAVDIH